jgi:hypothetical protein
LKRSRHNAFLVVSIPYPWDRATRRNVGVQEKCTHDSPYGSIGDILAQL